MADSLEQQIIEIIQNTLRNNGAPQDIVVARDDSMETLAAWDSLTFMSIFMSINDCFGINPDFDDAINYTSVQSLHIYLQEKITDGLP